MTFVSSLVAETLAIRDVPRGGGIDFTIHGAIAGGRLRVPVLWGWLQLVLGVNLRLAYLELDGIAALGCGRPITVPARGSAAPRFDDFDPRPRVLLDDDVFSPVTLSDAPLWHVVSY